MNNLASRSLFPTGRDDHGFGSEDENRGDIYSEAVRAARTFVSQSAKPRRASGYSWFVDTIVVPDLARQFSVLGHVVSHSQKDEIETTKKIMRNIYAYVSSQANEATDGGEIVHNYSTSRTGQWISPNTWTSSGRAVLRDESITIWHWRGLSKVAEQPRPVVPQPTPASAARQVQEARPVGFEDLAQFKQASFDELDTSFATQSFVASDKLLRIWTEGLNVLRTEADTELIEIPSDRTDRSLHKELEREVDSIISNYARYMSNRYGGQSFKLSFDGQFYAPFETVVADTLILPPRTSVLFLDELMRLLVEQAKNGAKFKRRWGELCLDSTGNLMLKLEKPKVRRAADYF